MTDRKVTLEDMLSALRAAGEETRLRLLVLLSQGEQSVKDITTILEQSQPRISRHLKLLAQSGLVERYQEGSWVYYRLAGENNAVGGHNILGRGQIKKIIHNMLDVLDVKQGTLAQDRERAQHVRLERKEIAQHYFHQNAAQWDEIRRLHIAEEQVEAEMLDMLGAQKFDVLVDLGTGTGRILELFSSRFNHGTGFDLNKDMLAYARDNLANAGLSHCQLRQGELCDIGLDDDSADAVIIHQVLHYLEEPRTAIIEAARILRPKGKILIVDFDRHDLDFLREEQAHRRLGFEDKQMRQWMKEAGLNVQDHRVLMPQKDAEHLTVSLWQGQKK